MPIAIRRPHVQPGHEDDRKRALSEELQALKKRLDEVLAMFAQDDREALRRFLSDSRDSRQALRAALRPHQPPRGEA